jgi:hypothetical protein
MSQQHEKLGDLERLLASLPPRPAALDRDRLLFRAGQASMRRNRLWPTATFVMSVTSACLAFLLVARPMPQTEVRIVRVQIPVPAPSSQATTDQTIAADAQPNTSFGQASESIAPAMSYWQMQRQAIRFGVEGLPSNVAYGDETPSAAFMDGPELSAGSRPKLIEHSSWFSFGEQ